MKRLKPEELRRTCDPSTFPFNTSAEAPLPERFIGQDRAQTSMQFGLAIESKGYNIFLAGPRGTGKSSIIEQLVRKIAASKPVPDDWCLVYNFSEPNKPRAIRFAPGMALKFKKQMEKFLKSFQENVPRLLEGKEFEEARSDIQEKLQQREAELLSELSQFASRFGFMIKKTQGGMLTIPVLNDQPLNQEEYDKLAGEEREGIRQKREKVDESVRETFRQLRKFARVAREKIQELERNTVAFAVDRLIDDLMEEYETIPTVSEYLAAVRKDILDNLDDFKPLPLRAGLELPDQSKSLTRYHVNVLVDNSALQGAPVIVELHPTYQNLFGKLERRVTLGAMVTDFTLVEAGSFLRANGGYLVLQAKDVLKAPFAWDGLKRSILNSRVQIEDMMHDLSLFPTAVIRPEPIPVNVKVIMTGDHFVYRLLHGMDEDFVEMFKVKVDFDFEMERTAENEVQYASFIRQVTETENLLPFERSAISAIVEYGSRSVENQEKLTSQFSAITDIIRESHFWAKDCGKESVSSEHVLNALNQKLHRVDLTSKKYQEHLEKGTILVDTKGFVTGQINGLAVYNLGDFVFGKPTRITANTFAGKSGVVNIEREAKLSGRTHDKGLLILSGYLAEKFAEAKPLSICASVCFEQSYERIDGDSASSTELLALLSSLADAPVDQGIAVTGSINQKGEFQPIGAVNYKVEGFFDLCKSRMLTGTQGVIIPHQNCRNLMLKPEVIEAVANGTFHIYAVKNIEEAIEVVTGLASDAIFSKIVQKLQKFAHEKEAKT
ncbi:AAA family ATPase [bacterium]|nr:AAA family ATPase [bacterium]